MKLHPFVALIIILTGALMSVALGQEKSTYPTPTAEDQELIRARKANEEAQAEYYREQLNKLRQPTPSPSPTPAKPFSQSLAENPASVVGVVGTIVAAFIASLVGLTTLYFNNRHAIKSQMDTQFYEAMKRLGDESSATIRASAAGLLAQMAQANWHELSLAGGWRPLKVTRSKPYFTTALDQLMTGLLLENSLVGIDSVKGAIEQLIPQSPAAATRKLYHINLRIQEDLGSLIAEFFVIRGCMNPPDTDPASQVKRDLELWEQLEHSTPYDHLVLRDFVSQSDSYRRRFQSYLRVFKTQSKGDVGQILSANQENLWVTSNRLRANVALFCAALARSPHEVGTGHNFDGSFLVGGGNELKSADLSGMNFCSSHLTGIWLFKANLEKTNFTFAYLKGADMSGGSLRGAYLYGARLHNAGLSNADMTEARIGGAIINDQTRFEDSNWWKANFYTIGVTEQGGRPVDVSLIESLYERYGEAVPSAPDELHPSVHTFLKSRVSS